MLFNSFDFVVVFLPIVILSYFLLAKLKNSAISTFFLVASSLYFYAYYHVEFLLLIGASMTVNYIMSLVLMRKKKKWLLVVGIVFNVGLLGYFKYADFFIENYNWVFGESIDLLYIALPLGISFITFQQIAYLVDTYRGEIRESKLSSYMLFSTFFPQLIAGPIVNHKDVITQYEDPINKRFNAGNFSKGLFVFVIGLVKKVVIADTLAMWVTDGFDHYTALTFIEAWYVVLAYSIQLYFDFSGYCDMAIGLGLMFNIRLPINFNSPYKARSVPEFWKRWHMTLNRFLTQYVYFPLGGSRKGEIFTAINILIVFFISGFWHGAGWTFVIWGMLHGVMSVLVRLFKKFVRIPMPYLLSWFLTFSFIVLARVYFRSSTVEQAHHVFGTLFSPDWASMQAFWETPPVIFAQAAAIEVLGYPLNSPILLISVLAMTSGICFFAKNTMQMLDTFRFNWGHIFYIQLLLLLLLLTIFFVEKNSVFIYFNF